MSSLKKNATLNIIKTVCSVIFPMITIPYATRVLGTETYGMYNFSSSIISYATLIAAFGITNYATREGARKRGCKQRLDLFVDEIFSLNILTTVVAYVFLAQLIVAWGKLRTYTDVILILSLNILFTTIGTDWINIVFEDYAYITKRYIICYVIQIVLMFLLVKTPYDVNIYAIVSVFSHIVANSLNIIYIRKRLGVHPKLIFSAKVLFHLKYVFVFFISSIASTIYINSDITILGYLKDDYAVGLYSISSKIYTLIKIVIGAMTAVIIPRVSVYLSEKKEEDIQSIIKETVGVVLIAGLPATAGIFFMCDNVITLISGIEYIKAFTSLRILSLSIVFGALSNVFVNAIMIPYRQEKKALFITISSAVINIGLNFLMIPQYSYNATAFTTLISELYVFIVSFCIVRKIVTLFSVRSVIISIAGFAIVFVCCFISKLLVHNYVVQLVFAVGISGIFYLFLLIKIRDNFVFDLFKVIMQKFNKRYGK